MTITVNTAMTLCAFAGFCGVLFGVWVVRLFGSAKIAVLEAETSRLDRALDKLRDGYFETCDTLRARRGDCESLASRVDSLEDQAYDELEFIRDYMLLSATSDSEDTRKTARDTLLKVIDRRLPSGD